MEVWLRRLLKGMVLRNQEDSRARKKTMRKPCRREIEINADGAE